MLHMTGFDQWDCRVINRYVANIFISLKLGKERMVCYSGVYGLWLDGDLYHGRTQPCLTYDNDLLTTSEDFVVQCLEVWGFS
jgi:hypothetical protein